MLRKISAFIFLLHAVVLPAQVSHFVQVRAASWTNKQTYLAGYAFGMRKICYNFSAGYAKGTDNQYLPPDKASDDRAIEKVRLSLSIPLVPYPTNSYLERCVSVFSVKQVRLGFSLYFRNDDTLGRAPFTGPHFGVDALAAKTMEWQTATWKSKSDETRLVYTGVNDFWELGAATSCGWQFAFFKQHLYVDLRAVIVFLYPMMHDPNTNSPFAGNRWEGEVGLGWHFYHQQKQKGDAAGKVRKGI